MAKVYKNPGPIKFKAVIQGSPPGARVDFPYDLKETYGVGNLVPFKATFDGRVMYQGSLAKMGGSCAMILLRKDIQAELGKGPGDEVGVVVELDDTPREIALPQDAKTALDTAGLLATFEGLAFSHRREYIQWIESAKLPETRVRRIAKMCEMIVSSKRSPH